jgi:hypothetical protein
MSYNTIRRQNNQAIINHVLRSRRIYDTIVQNMQRENDMLITALSNRPYYILTDTQSQSLTQPQPQTQTQTHSQSQSRANPIFMNLMDILLRGNGDAEAEANRGLTTEQIDNAITNHIFSELPETTRTQYTTCPITLDSFNNDSEVSVLRVCGHVFFRQPLRIWLEGRDTCPTCRTRVIQSSQEANPSQQQSQPEQPYAYRSNPNAMTYLFTFPNNDTNTNPNTSANNEANPLMSLIDNLVNQATQQITRGTNLGFGLELDNSGNISSGLGALGAGINANTNANTNPYSNNNIWNVSITDTDWRFVDTSGNM